MEKYKSDKEITLVDNTDDEDIPQEIKIGSKKIFKKKKR